MYKELQELCQLRALEFNSDSNRFFSEILVNQKSFTFNINEFSSEWIKFYKEEFVNSINNEFKKTIRNHNLNINFDDYIVIKYFYLWVLVDFFEILPFVPTTPSSILNIGAGIGYLDIILSKLYSSSTLNYYLIEKETSENELHYDGSEHSMKKMILPLMLLSKNFQENKIQNAFFYSPNNFKENIKNITKPINFIISIRSYCYLYAIDEYYEEIKIISNKDTFLIVDVHIDYTNEFKNKFIPLKQIKAYKTFTRVLAKLK